MNYIEQSTDALFRYRPALTKEDDFDQFWDKRLAQSKGEPLNAEKTQVDYPSNAIDVFETSYMGFDDTIVSGMLLVPQKSPFRKLPCLINYHGFTWHKGVPSNFAAYTGMGIAVLSIDIRGQGGLTRDRGKYRSGMANNIIVSGILDCEDSYYGRVYVDCIRAIDFVCSFEFIDPGKIIIHGGSQGGGLGMAVAALDKRPWITLDDVSSNSDVINRVEKGAGAFTLIQDYIKRYPEQVDQVFKTLSYIDTMNMAHKITCPVFASVGLRDPHCPAEQYMATYNRINSEKEISFYPYSGHEGGGDIHNEKKLRYLYSKLF